MKKIVKIMASLISVFSFCTLVIHANDTNLKETDYLKKYELVLKDFQDKVALSEKTGDLNVDFLNQILAYEQMGVEMGKAELQFGNSKKLKAVTHDYIKVMKHEIREIEKLMKQMEEDPVIDEMKETEYLELYTISYDAMLLALQPEKEGEQIKKGGSVDRDFVTKFTPYLEFKLQFANHALEKSGHEDIKALASTIVLNSEKQLKVLKEMQELIK